MAASISRSSAVSGVSGLSDLSVLSAAAADCPGACGAPQDKAGTRHAISKTKVAASTQTNGTATTRRGLVIMGGVYENCGKALSSSDFPGGRASGRSTAP